MGGKKKGGEKLRGERATHTPSQLATAKASVAAKKKNQNYHACNSGHCGVLIKINQSSSPVQ